MKTEGGTSVAVVCRKTGISSATFFDWKKKYAGLMPPEMRQLRKRIMTKNATGGSGRSRNSRH